MTLAVAGTLMQTPARDRLTVIDAVVEVDGGGTITAVNDRSTSEGAAAGRAALDFADERVDLAVGTFLMPGLVDLHIHAPQWPQLGTGLDLPLERWLFDYTFPLEARYRDAGFAAAVWDDLVPSLLAMGTTTAVYFSSNHLEATTALARACARYGQRALVGRVAMDHPTGTPEWYRDATASDGVEASAASIDAVTAVGSPLVEPIITPRFTPACTDALLEGLGELAAATGVRVQTHCAESDWHCDYALDRFGVSDSTALNRFGLVRPRTVLAHSDHLTPEEAVLVAGRGAGVAHCPLSNAYFANAVFGVRQALAAGVGVGLGSDIAGGARPGLLGVCQDAVTVSRMLEDGVDPALGAAQRGVPESRIDTVTAFWLATAGGAAVVDLPVGLIEPGRCFDAMAVRTDRPGGTIRLWDGIDDDARAFEKVVRLATTDDISHVWVDGSSVKP
ncbi:MAG: amidohydrolase family protein [Acidimicrobiaceae bacterium]|nr:amidohydrolase family protein [Acidimicrobiaceae bacterium]MDE0515710.1 amidohydrolase family protein [Acidimicrobiaceae bacterium]MDE0656796.1 amidohydrolase family protein [Acidimicrobiaceae bacterium]MXZ96631.1 amidohydrolase family protein [Acidimicrobiaceae bacterium]MYF42673.1 amidohydrolase family protein [Acidimicrobiaceae bacterium]